MRVFFLAMVWLLLTTGSAAASAAFDEVRASTVLCEGDCPAAVGAIVVLTTHGGRLFTNYCGATLVAPDLVLTAAHCLGVQSFREGQRCDDSVAVVFPETRQLRAESSRCARVERMTRTHAGSDWSPSERDYALLRLQAPSSRAPARVSGAGFEADASMTLYTPHEAAPPEGDTHRLVLRRKTCAARHGSVILPGSESAVSAMALLAPCRVVPGNSGTGVLAADGSVRGVVTVRRDFARAFSVWDSLVGFRYAPLEFEAPLHAAVVSNLACASLPGLLRQQGSRVECRRTLFRDRRALERATRRRVARDAARVERRAEQLRRGLVRWASSSEGRWRSEVRRETSRVVVRAVPRCRGGARELEAPVHVLRLVLDDGFRLAFEEATFVERVSLASLPACPEPAARVTSRRR